MLNTTGAGGDHKFAPKAVSSSAMNAASLVMGRKFSVPTMEFVEGSGLMLMPCAPRSFRCRAM